MNAIRVAPTALWIAGLSLVFGASRQSFGYEIQIVVPNGLENTEGDGSASPGFSGTGFRDQVAYSAAEFSGLPETHRVITGIAFRPDASITEPRTVDWGDTQWFLSTTTRDVDDMSDVFSENHGPNKSLVYEGPLILSTEATGPPEGPRGFDYSFDLQTPFLYDSNQGNLVVDMIVPAGYTPSLQDDHQYIGGRQQLVAFEPFDSPSANYVGSQELILQFTFITEPSTHVLQAGDADMDCDFDQLDLVKVQISGKYLTSEAATWGDGDWDGAPGGEPGNPPPGDGVFDQLDIIMALNAGPYLKDPYCDPGEFAAIRPVPEPSSVILLALGIAGAAMLRLRRKC